MKNPTYSQDRGQLPGREGLPEAGGQRAAPTGGHTCVGLSPETGSVVAFPPRTRTTCTLLCASRHSKSILRTRSHSCWQLCPQGPPPPCWWVKQPNCTNHLAREVGSQHPNGGSRPPQAIPVQLSPPSPWAEVVRPLESFAGCLCGSGYGGEETKGDKRHCRH